MATADDNRIARPAPSLYDGSALPRVRYLAEVTTRGFVHLAFDELRGTIDAAAIAAVGRGVVVHAGPRALAAFAWLPGELACLILAEYGIVQIEVAGHDADAARDALRMVCDRIECPEPQPARVTMAFWCASPRGGGEMRLREVEVTEWAEASDNYAAPLARALDRLAETREPARGRLIVWRGPPGTGKTWALRALAGAWRDWCGVHYVLDPLALMGADPRYLLDVLADDSGPPWRLVVLEDAGELIVHDAGRTGALATLLNLTDGILGHGTGTLVLVTTNEPVEHLHPAVRRRGRCLADLEFGPLSVAEARAWLERAGCAAEVDEPCTLAELFALADGGEAADEPVAVASPFGFGRALARVPA